MDRIPGLWLDRRVGKVSLSPCIINPLSRRLSFVCQRGGIFSSFAILLCFYTTIISFLSVDLDFISGYILANIHMSNVNFTQFVAFLLCSKTFFSWHSDFPLPPETNILFDLGFYLQSPQLGEHLFSVVQARDCNDNRKCDKKSIHLLFVTTPMSLITFGWLNWPIMDASDRKSRWFSHLNQAVELK